MDVPIVDINDLSNIRDACKKYGFFYVKIDSCVLEKLLIETKEFFDYDMRTKCRYIIGKNGFGYGPFKNKTSNDVEIKESLSYNPSAIKYDSVIMKEYFDTMSMYSRFIYSKIIESLGLDFDNYKIGADPGFNTLSLLHYPYTNGNVQQIGKRPHTDWGFITLLYTTGNGLQIYVNNEWQDIPIIKDHFIVNIGDMLQIISDGEYKSTLHRVVIKEEKYSIAFFFEPNLEYTVQSCKPESTIKPIKYCEYFKQKVGINIKKKRDIVRIMYPVCYNLITLTAITI